MEFPIKIYPDQFGKISEDIDVEKTIHIDYITKRGLHNSPVRLPEKPILETFGNKYGGLSEGPGCFIIWIAVIIVAILCLIFGEPWLQGTAIFYLFFIPLVSFIYRDIRDPLKESYEDLTEHNPRNREARKKYNQQMAEYEVLKEEAQKQSEVYRNKVEKAYLKFKKYKETSEYKKIYKQLFSEQINQRTKIFFKNATKPVNATISVQHGITENYFAEFLIRSFGSHRIMRSKQLEYYYPDFCLFISEYNCFIDIEIDEPYTGKSKEVIHYVDEGSYSDENRNDFFAENLWGVIRFSEKQILCQPDSCCKEIWKFMSDLIPQNPIKFIWGDIENIKPEKLWSSKQADEMALFDYRNTYIPDSLKQNFG